MLVIRCKNCGKQLESHPARTRSCQCENYTSIRGTNITGNDLSLIEIVTDDRISNKSVLSKKDLEFQESRKSRKINRSLLDSIDIR